MDKSIIILLSISLAFIFSLLFLFLTGRDKRAYPVLQPHDRIEITGKPLSITEIAQIYKPSMNLKPSTPSPPLLWIWYEAIQNNNQIDLIYYFVWEDEIHPNKIAHRLYSLYRSVYYGFPVYDIEYFQVGISIDSGEISSFMFETSPADDYFVEVSEHHVARYVLQPDGSYRETISTRQFEPLSSRENVFPTIEGTHIQAGVQTWNHLTCALTDADRDFTISLDAKLAPLTARDYSKYKFARKSQGDHRTPENPITKFIATILTALFFAVQIPVIRLIFRSKNESNAKTKEQ